MDRVNISTFKATCLNLLDRVKQTGRPLLITRRGEPIAEVIPPRPSRQKRIWVGAARDTGTINGDLIAPTGERWDAEEE